MKLDEIDLLAETWSHEVPHAAFDALRADDPVYWHPEPDGPGFWAVTRHADVVAVEPRQRDLLVGARRHLHPHPGPTRRWPSCA